MVQQVSTELQKHLLLTGFKVEEKEIWLLNNDVSKKETWVERDAESKVV